MECHDARSLIPSYLDGELSQAQAAPLRAHLLDCQPCRGSAQDSKNLKRWFQQPNPVLVPEGFAARVARAAVRGEDLPRLQPLAPLAATPSLAVGGQAAHEERETPLLRFVLTCTAAAALLLFSLSIGIRTLSLPQTKQLAADDRAEVQLDQTLQDLERLNRAEKAAGAQKQP